MKACPREEHDEGFRGLLSKEEFHRLEKTPVGQLVESDCRWHSCPCESEFPWSDLQPKPKEATAHEWVFLFLSGVSGGYLGEYCEMGLSTSCVPPGTSKF